MYHIAIMGGLKVKDTVYQMLAMVIELGAMDGLL